MNKEQIRGVVHTKVKTRQGLDLYENHVVEFCFSANSNQTTIVVVDMTTLDQLENELQKLRWYWENQNSK